MTTLFKLSIQAIWQIAATVCLLVLSGCLGSGLYPPGELGDAPQTNLNSHNASESQVQQLKLNVLSPSPIQTPGILGVAGSLCNVMVYSGANCTGARIASGDVAANGEFNLASSILAEGTYNISAKCVVASGTAECTSTSVPYVVDRTGPTLTVSAPSFPRANSAAQVSFVVHYSETSSLSLNASHVTLSTTGGASCSKNISGVTAQSAVIELSNCTGNGTVGITIAAGSALDMAGNSASASPASATFVVDNIGMSAAMLSPASGDYSVFPSLVYATLDEIVDGNSVSVSDVMFSSNCPGVSVSSVSVSGNEIIAALVGTASCSLMDTMDVTFDLAGVQDSAGNWGSNTFVGNYRLNNVGPTSAVFSPVAGAVNAIPSTVAVTFPTNVDASTVSTSDFSLSGTCGTVGVSSASASGNVATVTLSGVIACANGQTVQLSANLAGIQDSLGNAGSGTASALWTKDSSGPTVSFSHPDSVVSEMPISISATFGSDTLMSTVTASDISVTGTCPTATLGSVNKAGLVATIQLIGTTGCTTMETMTIEVDLAGVSDTAGNAGVGTVGSTFLLDTVAPSVMLSISSGNLGGLPTSIAATFSADTDMSTVNSNLFALSGSCVVAGIGSVVQAGNVATAYLSNTASCVNGQTMGLAVSLAGVKDIAGNAASGGQSAMLTLNTTLPTASFGTPSGTFSVIPWAVEVVFDADTDMSTVSAADFSLSGSCGVAIIGSVVKVAQVAKVNLAGTGGCASGSTMSLSLAMAGVVDSAGNAGVGTQTANYVFDDVGPTASFAMPSGSANPLPTTVAVTFSADTDMSTVSAADFSLAGTCTNPSISSVSKAGQVATVNLNNTTLCPSMSTIQVIANLASTSDLIGNSGVGAQISTYLFDDVPPTIALDIAAGTYKPFPTQIAVTFSADTNMSTVPLSIFTLLGTCLTASMGTPVVAGNVVTIPLLNTNTCGALSTLIFTSVMAGVADVSGNVGIGSSTAIYLRGL